MASAAIERLNKAIPSLIGNRSGLGMGAVSAAMKSEVAEIARSVWMVEQSAHAMGMVLTGLDIGHGFGEFIKASADCRKELIALQNSGNALAATSRVSMEGQTQAAYPLAHGCLGDAHLGSDLAGSSASTDGDGDGGVERSHILEDCAEHDASDGCILNGVGWRRGESEGNNLAAHYYVAAPVTAPARAQGTQRRVVLPVCP